MYYTKSYYKLSKLQYICTFIQNERNYYPYAKAQKLDADTKNGIKNHITKIYAHATDHLP